MGRVEGKVAFITGAARGQGRSHAVRLAEEGADIVAVDLCGDIDTVPYGLGTEADLDETRQLVENQDGRIIARQADVRDTDSMSRVLADATAELGRLDIVVANAGITSAATAAEMSDQTWQDVIDVDLTGVWKTTKAAIPYLNDGGSIVITSSVVGIKSAPNIVHYAAAKQGLTGVMQVLAQELAGRWIRVNTVHPSTVHTPMIHNQMTYDLFLPEHESPGREDFLKLADDLQLLPCGVMDPVEISNAVLFLASEEARCITGVTLPVDGGFLARF